MSGCVILGQMSGSIKCGYREHACNKPTAESTLQCVVRIRRGYSDTSLKNYLKGIHGLKDTEALRVANIPISEFNLANVGEMTMRKLCPLLATEK